MHLLNFDYKKLNPYYRYHATGSRSEVTVACLVSLMLKIFCDKSYTTNCSHTVDNEETCKQWFLSAHSCQCNIETKQRLKPKKLFWGNMFYSYYILLLL